ncbi:MAG: ATP-binding cassette domain-containing protein, partial [Planctomycetota bacterium]
MKEAKALFIQDLTIQAGRHLLLDKANLTIQPQELVLLVGPSGCGKSIFLKFLSGLISSDTHGFSISGEVEIFGKSLQVQRKKALAKVGIVFQEHSLFDEFSPLQNIQFAMDHSAYFWTKEERNKFFEQVKTNLALDPKTPVIHYSGGQKKRLALARTLAYHPEILIYDEPTAGLDPKNAKEVASLIGKTHHTYQKTTIVVTHEYRYLLPIAHQVIFFNPETKKLERIEKDEIEEKMAHAASPSPSQSLSLLRKVWESPKNTTLSLLETTGRFGVLALSSLYFLFPIWKRFKWGLRYLAYYFRLLFSFSAFLYLALAGAIVGFVVTYFTFQFLPYRSYNEPLLIDDILAALGFSLYR